MWVWSSNFSIWHYWQDVSRQWTEAWLEERHHHLDSSREYSMALSRVRPVQGSIQCKGNVQLQGCTLACLLPGHHSLPIKSLSLYFRWCQCWCSWCLSSSQASQASYLHEVRHPNSLNIRDKLLLCLYCSSWSRWCQCHLCSWCLSSAQDGVSRTPLIGITPCLVSWRTSGWNDCS